MMKLIIIFISIVAVVIGLAAAAWLLNKWPGKTPDVAVQNDWQALAAAPLNEPLSVYWVGHSLMESKQDTLEGEVSLFTMMEQFSQAREKAYQMGEHTLYGSPLSLLWRGNPHSYQRQDDGMLKKRIDFQNNAARYNAMVLIDTVPVSDVVQVEYSAYYAQQFYATLMRSNPDARVYLYEGWVDRYGHTPNIPLQYYDWRSKVLDERHTWNMIADQASSAKQMPGPNIWRKLLSLFNLWHPADTFRTPVFIIPVATAMVELADQLNQSDSNNEFLLASGERLTIDRLFANAYTNWPRNWPLPDGDQVDVQAIIDQLQLRFPGKPIDDIHASDVGIYFAALVHYAVLYRESPEGLPALNIIGDQLALRLQQIAWSVVTSDPRTGVKAP